MKTIVALLVFVTTLSINAQSIDSIVVIPSNPNTSDTIKVIVYSNSPYSYCDLDSFQYYNNNNEIFVTIFTHLGDLSSPCYSVDTLTLGTMNSGTYTLFLDLSLSSIVYDSDSVIFTVQLSNGIKALERKSQNYFPNPVNDWLTIPLIPNITGSITIEILDILGKVIFSENQTVTYDTLRINITDIKNGNYLFKLTFHDGTSEVFKVSVIK